MNILQIKKYHFKYIHEGHLSLKDSDYEQSNFPIKIKNWDKGKKKQLEKIFLNNLGLLLSARENVLNNLESRLFPMKKSDKTPIREP